MKPSSKRSVMAATASPRRPHSIDSRRSSRGHVAMTMVTAQIAAGRNGWRTRKPVTISPLTKPTASVTRTGSRDASVSITLLPAPAERLVDAHHREHLVTAGADQAELRVDELPLAVEHLEIARVPPTVPDLSEPGGVARRAHQRLRRRPELVTLAVVE